MLQQTLKIQLPDESLSFPMYKLLGLPPSCASWNLDDVTDALLCCLGAHTVQLGLFSNTREGSDARRVDRSRSITVKDSDDVRCLLDS